MVRTLSFARDGKTWPHRDASRFVRSGHIVWHVQDQGPPAAPVCLMIHGTGAASHSFRGLIPFFSQDHRVLVPDLPGHGFTTGARRRDLALPGMSRALGGLLRTLETKPDIVIGHSAGAALLLQAVLDGHLAPRLVFGLNSALEAIPGNAFLSPLAKVLFFNPWTANTVAMQARIGGLVQRLLKATGSQLDDEGKACYALLVSNPAHVKGALGMMAGWDLDPLVNRLGEIRVPVNLIAAADDPMVPARVSRSAARFLPGGRSSIVETGGHLLHEIAPGRIAGLVREDLARFQAG